MQSQNFHYLQAWERQYKKKGPLWRGTSKIEFEIPINSKVLELGCGNGKTTSALSLMPIQLYAIDFSAKAVEQTKELLERIGGKAVEARQMDGMKIG